MTWCQLNISWVSIGVFIVCLSIIPLFILNLLLYAHGVSESNNTHLLVLIKHFCHTEKYSSINIHAGAPEDAGVCPPRTNLQKLLELRKLKWLLLVKTQFMSNSQIKKRKQPRLKGWKKRKRFDIDCCGVNVTQLATLFRMSACWFPSEQLKLSAESKTRTHIQKNANGDGWRKGMWHTVYVSSDITSHHPPWSFIPSAAHPNNPIISSWSPEAPLIIVATKERHRFP